MKQSNRYGESDSPAVFFIDQNSMEIVGNFLLFNVITEMVGYDE